VVVLPILDHSAFEAGLFDTLLRSEQSLAFIGLGVALAAVARRQLSVNLIFLAFGIGTGAVLGEQLAAMIEENAGVAGYAILIGPIYCAATGVALTVPAALRHLALPLAALSAGVVLGLPIVADSLSRAQVEFSAGALLAGIGLVLVPLLLLRPFAWSGVAIAGRILGAWLIAIGLMLLTLELTRFQG
jgi:hypothetical protein